MKKMRSHSMCSTCTWYIATGKAMQGKFQAYAICIHEYFAFAVFVIACFTQLYRIVHFIKLMKINIIKRYQQERHREWERHERGICKSDLRVREENLMSLRN